MRKAAFIAAGCLIAAVLLAVLVPRVVSLDFLKPRIVAALEEKTGRKVSFSNLSLTLIPGIGAKITDLSVSGDPDRPGERFLSVPEADVRVSLLPLFSGRAEIDRFILRRPEVLFRSYRDGTNTATKIARRLSREEKAPPGGEEKVAIALEALSIEDAKLTMVVEDDRGRETRWRIDPLSVRLSGIGKGRKEFELATRIDGAIRGEIALAGSAVPETGAASVPGAFRISGRGKVFGQPVTVEGRIEATSGPAAGRVALTFSQIDIAKIPGIFADPPPILTQASLKGTGSLTATVDGRSAGYGFAVKLSAPSLVATAAGEVSASTGKRVWNAAATIESLSEFAKGAVAGVSGWAPSGRLAATAGGSRTPGAAKETWSASLSLADVGFRLPSPNVEVAGMNGRVALSESAVDFEPLSGSLNGRRFTVRGPVFLGAPPSEPVSVEVAFLDLDTIFPPEEGGKAKKEAPHEAGTKGGTSAGISARGTLTVDAGRGRGLEFKDLSAAGRYETGTLHLDSMRVRLYGGDATASGWVRPAGQSPECKLAVAVKDVEANEILSRKTTLKDYITGKAYLKAQVAGGIRDFKEFTRTAKGSGSFRVAGGKIRGVDLLDAAAGASGLGSSLQPSKGGGAGETAFSDLSADFRIDGGKIRSDSLRIVSDRLGLAGSAVLGFDRGIDFRGTLSLSGGLSERVRGSAGRFLTGPSGRVEIPLTISGPVTSPRVAVDAAALARGLAGETVRKLEERLKGGPPAAGGETGKPADRSKPGTPLEGLFERLLPGKK